MLIGIVDIVQLLEKGTPLSITAIVFVLLIIFRKPIFEFLLSAAAALKRARSLKGRGMEVNLEPTQEVVGEKPTVAPSLSTVEEIASESKQSQIGQSEPIMKAPIQNEPVSTEQLRLDMIEAFGKGDANMGEVKFKKLLEIETDTDLQLEHRATYLMCRYMWTQDVSALPRLQEMVDKNQAKRAAFFYIGVCHESNRSYEKAFRAFHNAANASTDIGTKSRHLVRAAEALSQSGAVDRAIAFIENSIATSMTPDERFILYSGLADLYEPGFPRCGLHFRL